MRLVTRSDFDGLACGVLLKYLGLIDDFKFAHPKDLQDGIVEVTDKDILANVPYVPGCAMWFDHHSSEEERLETGLTYQGCSRPAPSCARVVWEYYGGHERFPAHFDEMMLGVDRVDSGNLTIDDVLEPAGWVLLGFVMDPRTGLGRYKDYRISNYQLMMELIDHCTSKTAEEILALPDVRQRTDRYFAQEQQFSDMLKRCTRVDENIAIVDLRNEQEIFTGNRFTLYALYPRCNVSVQVIWGLRKENVVFTVGHSILNRTCTADIGRLMLQHGGGGHQRVGTCQVVTENAEKELAEVLDSLRGK